MTAAADALGAPEVEAFTAGMEQLGEPFLFGLDDPAEFFARCGLTLERRVPSRACEAGPTHPIYDLYHFCVLRHASGLPS